ncbi:diguanylate cyclase (GGDEF)-like protein/PAS domain S-box-containing protein [Crossiella equi]|uniref:Diguanylate cyclase (GGDEF)-like protein/PAS domain S-box-containing protein n=1 Tax=Crossiella equi TaxID=130796 RepID=A0ABS5ALA1_9PSEU|nr:EAL domain-containing protein [Crossiella equi]MBP2477326.1 diguanylate cyclase (GGDEF)-like protein/PAS domain S-box-containing protein [Crossiella equi]
MPEPSRQPNPAPLPDHRERRTLARKWAYQLAESNYVPLPHARFEEELAGLLDELCAAVLAERPEAAETAGARLVELSCTDETALPRTMDVLARGLCALPELGPLGQRAEAVVRVLGALAAGYVTAARRALLDQQQSMQASLLKAVRDAKYNLRTAQARFDEVAVSSASGILITELDGTVVRANGALAATLGLSVDEVPGRNLFDLVPPDHAPVLREDYRALLDGRIERVKQSQRLLHADGEPVPVSLTASLLRGAGEEPGHFVTVVEDGTELVLLQNELSRQALHDVLTGLPNRQYFGTRLESALRRADPAHGVTLLQLELDAYPVIRDGLGERVSGQLLVLVAQRLKQALAGERAVVARFDGAEFAVLVERGESTPAPAELVRALRRELAEPAYVDGHGLATSVSVGVLHHPAPDRLAADLLRDVHRALRRAKASGPGQCELSHPGQTREDRAQDALAATMPGAFASGEVEVRYRPLRRLRDGHLEGVQALLSWPHPVAGPIGDIRCRELAETTGLMLTLGEHLLRTACQRAAWWRRRHAPDLLLSVAVSPHQAADSDLVGRVLTVLAETSYPAEGLLLSVPADALAEDLGETRDNLATLADIGVRTAVHGFGLGAADLASAEDLPLHAVALSPHLAARAKPGDSPVTAALRALPGLLHRTGARLLVPDLDAEEDVAFWRAAGADLAAGDLLGGPVTAEELTSALGDRD